MRQFSNRVININKADLIAKIKENKQAHIKDYTEAVEAFKIQANNQIEKAGKHLESGELNEIKLNLKVPVNKESEYDKLVIMFEWEQKDIVELSQQEFNEYILDESDFAVAARLQNSTYKGI